MKIDIEYKDIVFLRDIIIEKQEQYRKQLLSGYTDESTSIDTINEIESNQKRISRIADILHRY
jgi:hypothetical protein